VLRPADVRLTPIGLVPDDIAAIADVFDDDTVYSLDDDAAAARIDADRLSGERARELDWPILVRLFGPVEVVDRYGTAASFERSKTRELIVWLATHRDRMTRSNARTALWAQDVRDATFANVVSEARRGLARLVTPDGDDEWIARTLTDSLPLHDGIVTDADLLEDAVARARFQEPIEAIATLAPVVERLVGIPFEGTEYLWPDGEGIASHLVLLATSAAAQLATHCLAIGDVGGVFSATGRGLRVLPGHEQLIALRMQAHAGAGDHAGVRLEWQSYERAINADAWSDGEPSPKLVELRRRLLHPTP
jgi:two-component SAPR family response regulator